MEIQVVQDVSVVCPSVRLSVSKIAATPLEIFKFCLHQSIHMINGLHEFEDGQNLLTPTRSKVKVKYVFHQKYMVWHIKMKLLLHWAQSCYWKFKKVHIAWPMTRWRSKSGILLKIHGVRYQKKALAFLNVVVIIKKF